MKNAKILIIEDQLAISYGLKYAFTNYGAEVVDVFKNSSLAIANIKEKGIDYYSIIIVDEKLIASRGEVAIQYLTNNSFKGYVFYHSSMEESDIRDILIKYIGKLKIMYIPKLYAEELTERVKKLIQESDMEKDANVVSTHPVLIGKGLLDKGYSISAAINESGMDKGNFFKAFRNKFKMTPKEYQKKKG